MPAALTARSRVIWLILCCAVVGVAGAAQPKPKPVGKLDVSRMWALEVGEAKAIDLEGQPRAQTFTVEFASAKCPVSVYVFKEEDAKGDDAVLTADPKKALASATATAGLIKAEVPEKTATRVIFRGTAVKTTLNLKLTNQLVVDTKDAAIKKLEDENAALKKELADLKKRPGKQQ
jgi:hypothetical protein